MAALFASAAGGSWGGSVAASIWRSWDGRDGYFWKRRRSLSEESRARKGFVGSMGEAGGRVCGGGGMGAAGEGVVVEEGSWSGGWFSRWVLLQATEQLSVSSQPRI